ncbi:MAG: hypothetical protein HY891_01415 [Deltaproteobacteria bacterium]|nr:hypothetical protein [Deltaproteobacteria bacterium]
MKISIGTNLIEDCTNAIVISGTPLFSYKPEPDGIKLSFDIASPPASTPIKVEENKVIAGDISVKANKNTVFIELDSVKLIELHYEGDTAIVSLDLRPLSLHIYSDTNALYIGGATLSENIIKNCTNGIGIGD